VDHDVDGQERTGMEKKMDQLCWGIDTAAAIAAPRALAGARRCGGFGSYGTRAMWRARFAYLEVVVLVEGGRRRRPFFLKLGQWCGGSLVYLRLWGKHQWERRTLAILPERLARPKW
jgi:hypothetical protein